MLIYDAENQIAGRLATIIAKKLLEGERIIVVNAEKAIISGDPKMVIRKFREKRERGDPHKGPFYPRKPDRIFRRIVRGMLPWKKKKGRDAYKRLKVYVGIPEELKDKKDKFIKTKEADANKLRTKYISLGEISKALGG
ncbi:MAG: 50S ribosomal protein L13 [Candidatus Aenigmarchaeota archaeon ex4484_224]|nr:MAG: 50S ribosomal protein L13 [Candidatus Aenigmarchaeota archaeon ex4484_224]